MSVNVERQCHATGMFTLLGEKYTEIQIANTYFLVHEMFLEHQEKEIERFSQRENKSLSLSGDFSKKKKETRKH